MKKNCFFLLILCIYGIGCVSDNATQPTVLASTVKAEELKNRRQEILTTENITQRVNKIKKIYDEYPKHTEKEFIINYREDFLSQKKYLDIFMQSGEIKDNLNCFVNSDSAYFSDECILVRRKLAPSKVGNFDYNALLPEGHKILTDDDFINLLSVDFYFGVDIDDNGTTKTSCDVHAGEWTSVEINNCNKNVEKYIADRVMGKLPLCRNVAKKDFENLFNITSMFAMTVSPLGVRFQSEEFGVYSPYTECTKVDELHSDELKFEIEHECIMGNIDKEHKQKCNKILKLFK